MQVNVIYALKTEKWHTAIQKSKYMLLILKNLQNMHYAWTYSPKGQNMQTCTEKVSIFGVAKS